MISEFARFLLVGAVAAAANIGSRWVFSNFVSFGMAIAAAYVVGMSVAFILNRSFVFSVSSRHPVHQAARFTFVNLLALLQVWAISEALARWIFPKIGFVWEPELVAHTIGVLSPVVTSYYGHKYYSYG